MNEIKLQTAVDPGRSAVEIPLRDTTVVLGSCFADSIGQKMEEYGFDVCVNPFGTLYNPVSIAEAVSRLESGRKFSSEECVRMGAGSELVCSFSHHTSFARKTEEEFLEYADSSLEKASAMWRKASKVIVTLGTAWCYEHIRSGRTVSNCLKIDAKEFRRRRLDVEETAKLLEGIVEGNPEKEFIFTVSPIRHLKDGAHGSQLSKSTLLLAIDRICTEYAGRADYFPAYEIILDELRDYRFYAEDLVHPSGQAVECLWSRFLDFCLPPEDREEISARDKQLKRSRHRQMH
ncbi:MAG: GSCFA domain-containing protein [Candidatus Cryptobacteroides sp.]